MSEKLLPFDMSSELNSNELIYEYLSQVLEDGDSDEIIRALGHIAKAKGMATVEQETGLGRESLSKALSTGSKPRFDTILKVIRALGIKLHAESRF
jgi:probable addiction module antidote protein